MARAEFLVLTVSALLSWTSASWAGLQSDEAADGPGLGLVQMSVGARGGVAGGSAVIGRVAQSAPPAPGGGDIRAKLLDAVMPHRESLQVPVLYVDLDAKPELRWRNVTRFYLDIGVYPSAFDLVPEVDQLVKTLLRSLRLDEEIRREVRGIVAHVNHPSATEDRILLMNLGYELSHDGEAVGARLGAFRSIFRPRIGCSGLLAAMPNGTVVHGRNMDYSGFEVTAPNGRVLHYPDTTAEVIFMRGGKPLFTSVQWPGMVGVHTGMRFGGWSYEQNTRSHSVEPDVLYGIQKGSEGCLFVARRLMETIPDFESAVQALYNTNFMAPMYTILSGPGLYEGAVIAHDRGGEHVAGSPLITRLSSSTPAIKDGAAYKGWKVIQTNDDQDHRPADYRRPVEEAKLALASQGNVSTSWMLGQMLALPLFQEATVFTSVFVPATGYHRTIAHIGSKR